MQLTKTKTSFSFFAIMISLIGFSLLGVGVSEYSKAEGSFREVATFLDLYEREAGETVMIRGEIEYTGISRMVAEQAFDTDACYANRAHNTSVNTWHLYTVRFEGGQVQFPFVSTRADIHMSESASVYGKIVESDPVVERLSEVYFSDAFFSDSSFSNAYEFTSLSYGFKDISSASASRLLIGGAACILAVLVLCVVAQFSKKLRIICRGIA